MAFILDVDGVMTDGKFYYSEQGKMFKVFGADDNDALSMLSEFIHIEFVTGDKRGFGISHKRIAEDMKMPLSLVSTTHRINWIKEKFPTDQIVYMGDGIFDHLVFNQVAYSIAPANADANCKQCADYITERSGGDRAVAEACLHIMSTFFDAFDTSQVPAVNAGIKNGSV